VALAIGVPQVKKQGQTFQFCAWPAIGDHEIDLVGDRQYRLAHFLHCRTAGGGG
jgi:hypothetical protein